MSSLILFIKGMFSPYVFIFLSFFFFLCEELAVAELFAVKKKMMLIMNMTGRTLPQFLPYGHSGV